MIECNCCGKEVENKNESFCKDCRENIDLNLYIRTIKRKLPKRYWKLQDKYNMRKDINNYIDKSLYLFGKQGVGKTTKATFILKKYVRKYCKKESAITPPVKFISMPELIFKLQYDMDSRRRNIHNTKISQGLLILDDFAVSKITEFVIQTSYLIIDYREKNNLNTIITSNLNLDQIEKRYNPRLSSRIAGMCEIEKMTGKDKRLL